MDLLMFVQALQIPEMKEKPATEGKTEEVVKKQEKGGKKSKCYYIVLLKKS